MKKTTGDERWDPVLALHQLIPAGQGAPVMPQCYELAGLRTASIADTMVRACALVRRLHAGGALGPSRRLLVVGGGAGGASAAVTAASLGVPVVLCLADAAPFHVQAGSPRVVNPTEYHWPHPHWALGRFPAAGTVPFPWATSTGVELAQTWTLGLDRWRNDPATGPFLTVLPNVRLQKSDLQTVPGVGVNCPKADDGQGAQFAAVLSFAGMLHDGSRHLGFQSFPYWQADPLDQPDLGLPGPAYRLLVSGAGDGGLQDFIRALTGKTAGTAPSTRPCRRSGNAGRWPAAESWQTSCFGRSSA